MEFEEIKQRLKSLPVDLDPEMDHRDADRLLEEIALSTDLTHDERKELVGLYRDVPKWYA